MDCPLFLSSPFPPFPFGIPTARNIEELRWFSAIDIQIRRSGSVGALFDPEFSLRHSRSSSSASYGVLRIRTKYRARHEILKFTAIDRWRFASWGLKSGVMEVDRAVNVGHRPTRTAELPRCSDDLSRPELYSRNYGTISARSSTDEDLCFKWASFRSCDGQMCCRTNFQKEPVASDPEHGFLPHIVTNTFGQPQATTTGIVQLAN